MKIIPTSIPDVLILEPTVFGDERGFFFESFNERVWRDLTGLDASFVQHNHSRSASGVLRGLHYQIQNPQGKLVRVIAGEVLMWPLISAAAPRPSDAGSAPTCLPKTKGRCGCRPALPTGSWSHRKWLNFFI